MISENSKALSNLVFPKRITICYKFNQNISSVFNIMKNFELSQSFFADIYDKPQYIIGKNTYTVNNEFSINWNYHIKLYFKVLYVSNNENKDANIKKIAWKITPENLKLSYEHCYTFLYDSLYDITVLKWEITYETSIFPFTKNLLKKYKQKLLKTCYRYDKFIKFNSEISTVYESMIIRGDRQKIFNIITNVEQLSKFFPRYFEQIKFYKLENAESHLGIINNNYYANFIDKRKFSFFDTMTNREYIAIKEKENCDINNSKWKNLFSISTTDGKSALMLKLKINLIEVSEMQNFLIIDVVFEPEISLSLYKSYRKILTEVILFFQNHPFC